MFNKHMPYLLSRKLWINYCISVERIGCMCICLSTHAVDVVDIDDIDESVQTSYGIGLIESIN